jgi:GNAT superfamily N-acetyltransferase
MVYMMLPSGRTVQYETAEGEEIPTIPVSAQMEPESAITASTDAIAEESQGETGRGELLVPYVPYARRFYLPQWVAFDNEGKLLVRSVSDAEAAVASMQRFLAILHTAVYLAHYMVVDEEYQRKRYGMLGQLITRCPRGEAGKVVDHAVRHWHDVTSVAVAMQGAFNAPAQPTVEFLLRFVQSAVNCWRESGGVVAPQPTPPKPLSKKIVPQLVAKPIAPEDEKADLATIAKLLGKEL